MIWDIYKYKRDKKEKEKTVTSAVEKELKQNISILLNNKGILEKELTLIENGKAIITPLNRLKNGFWDLIKIHLPKKYDNPDYLLKIDEVFSLINIVNNQIRNREMFKINNKALSSYNSILKVYDEYINDLTIKLIDEISKLLEMTNKNKAN
jgi:hypothetical protein